MDLALRIYDVAPTLAQHALTTLRGVQLRRLRYTDATWARLEELEQSQWWPASRARDYQLLRLRELVAHAAQTTPLYIEKYKRAGVNASALRSLEDLAKLPVLSKEEFRKGSEQAISSKFSRKGMWLANTSGTSGMPLHAFYTHRAMQERTALCERAYRWYTPGKFRRRASFTGKLIVPVDRPARALHRKNLALNQYLFSAHHLTEELLPRYVDELAAIGPQQIDGILSPMFVVAQHAIAIGRTGEVRPNVVFPTSETLWEHMRASLAKAFGCKVANFYGSQEGAPIAYECPQGGFHICPESGIFEVLRPNGDPCQPGEVGDLVVTAFTSEGTPLIRYAIGDVASLSAKTCECGRAMPLLESVHGRADDMFYTTERGVVPRVDSAFKSIPSSILATQVAQTGPDEFEVRIAVDRTAYQDSQGEQLLHNLTDYLGRRVKLRLKQMDSIPTTKGGKVRAQVNEYRSERHLREIREAWDSRNQS
jgi:phenylacetate-CoA ligase